jgi:hypothetical protein
MAEIEAGQGAAPTLRTRGAGYSVMHKLLEVQGGAPRRGRVARLLGVSPLHPDAVDLFEGALGQLETGRQLATLNARYTVLHSLPLGDTEGSDSVTTSAGGATATGFTSATDIGHLVIGPAGVFCLNSTREITATSVTTVQLEARRVSKYLSRALQRVIPVTPLLVDVGDGAGARGDVAKGAVAKGASTVDSPAPGVTIVSSRSLSRWFSARGPVLTTAELATLALAAEQPGTWRSPTSALQQSIPVDEFRELKSEVDAANAQGRTALAVTTLVAVCVALVTAMEITTRLAPLFVGR